jgi:hypothetical protein
LDGHKFENCCHRIFSIYLILPAALGPGVYSASNRDEYQKQKKKCFWGVECSSRGEIFKVYRKNGKSRENFKMKSVTDKFLLNRMGMYGHILNVKM